MVSVGPAGPEDASQSFRRRVLDGQQHALILQCSGLVQTATIAVLARKHPTMKLLLGGLSESLPHLPPDFASVSLDTRSESSVRAALEKVKVVVFSVMGSQNAAYEVGLLAAIAKETNTTLILLSSKAFASAEKVVKDSGATYSILRVPHLLDNHWAHLNSIMREGVIYGCQKPDTPLNSISSAEVGLALGALIANPRKNMLLFLETPAYSYGQLANLLSKSLEREIAYAPVDMEVASLQLSSEGVPPTKATLMLRSMCLSKLTDQTTKSNPFVDAWEELLDGRAPSTIEQWIGRSSPALKAALQQSEEWHTKRRILFFGSGNDIVGSALDILIERYQSQWEVYMGCDYEGEAAGGTRANVTSVPLNFKSDESLLNGLEGMHTLVITPPNSPDRVSMIQKLLYLGRQQGLSGVVLICSAYKAYDPVETIVKESGIRYTVVRIPVLLSDSLSTQVDNLVKQNSLVDVVSSDSKLNSLTLADAAKVLASVVEKPYLHINKTYTCTAPDSCSFKQVAKILSKALGAKITYKQAKSDAMAEDFKACGVSVWEAEDAVAARKYACVLKSKASDFVHICGEEPTTLKNFIKGWEPELKRLLGEHKQKAEEADRAKEKAVREEARKKAEEAAKEEARLEAEKRKKEEEAAAAKKLAEQKRKEEDDRKKREEEERRAKALALEKAKREEEERRIAREAAEKEKAQTEKKRLEEMEKKAVFK